MSPTDSSEGKCAPDGSCEIYQNDKRLAYVPGDNLCPDDPKMEPPLGGETFNQVDSAFFLSSPHFDSHYCEFPTQPWPVDRCTSSDPFI